MDKLFVVLFCGFAFVAIGAFVLSSFDASFIAPVMDSVNFTNPLLLVLVVLGIIGVASYVFSSNSQPSQFQN